MNSFFSLGGAREVGLDLHVLINLSSVATSNYLACAKSAGRLSSNENLMFGSIPSRNHSFFTYVIGLS